MNIDRKLRLTAAFVGAATRKDLAAAFRRVNPATAFDVDRADKWLQGRSTPRQFSVYEDWIKMLELPKQADWIVDCDLDSFVGQICEHHGRDRQQLERRAMAFGKPQQPGQDDRGATIVGRYACYSHSWSPYFRGQFIRGTLVIEQEHGPQRLTATYIEHLPTMRLQLKGHVTVTRRSVYIHVGGPSDDTHFFFALFPFSPPGSVLGGYLAGTTVLGPESQPSATRVVLVRLKQADMQSNAGDGYLDPALTIPQDLARFDIDLAQPDVADLQLRRFLTRASDAGADQIATDDFQPLVEMFDREWLGR
ncbi:hypothetical protein CO731_01123 [Aminobacter sp. MSH1]|uniref:hypothetical protein n=1 Tax=Aminobacter sp. MSH1 TaxID=374606 RepID=UPI000D37E0A7|nr:hypothetical protein [Aminobacter sp. MSH1]AWC21671.1 hypothetical protein CO731_01123 [Aminobacter sp. MSH1]